MARAKKVTKPEVDEDGRRDPESIKPGEARFVKTLLKRVDAAKSRTLEFREQLLPLFREYAWGTRFRENAQGSTAPVTYRNTRTNLCYATIATLLPHVYAKQPEIAVAPTEAVAEQDYEKMKGFAKTSEVMIDRCLVREGRLKQRGKTNVRAAMTTGVGWLKLGFQESLAGDPIMLQRHNDLQDNLQEIEHLVVKSRNETDLDKLAEQREMIAQQIAAVRSNPEVRIFKGFVVDRVQTEDILILDDSIVEFDAYADADAIAHGVWFTPDQYYARFGYKHDQKATEYGATERQKSGSGTGDDDANKAKGPWLRVWEIWSKRDGRIYTVCEGAKGYCRPPMTPKYASKRWYPFFGLAFNQVEGRFRPISDIELLYQLQDEYNTTRFFYAEARKESVPVRIFRKSGELKEEDIQALKNRQARQWVGIDGNPAVPLDQDIMQLEPFKANPEDFDVTIIRNDMDMLVGLSDASRANLIQAKTATEAEIMRQALMTRAAERQDTNEDMISEMSESSLQIMLQAFTKDEVLQIAGQQAAWPDEPPNVDEIFNQIAVSVRAGSTGKPNAQKEREQWATIMPILKDTAAQVAELRASGQEDMAQSLIELVKETLKRYDERIDVDRFIPRPEMGADGKPVNQAAQKLAQTMQELQQCQEELQKCQAELQSAKAQEQVKLAEATTKRELAIEDQQQKAALAIQQERTKQADIEAQKALAAQKQADAAAEREANLEAQERAALIKVAGDLIGKTLESGMAVQEESDRATKAEGEAASLKKHYDKILDQLATMLGTMAGDVVADYDDEDNLKGVTREPAELLGTDSMEKLLQAIGLISRQQVPEYDDRGRIVRLSRRHETVQ